MASVNWWIESWVTYSLPVAAVCPCVPGSPATFPVTLPHCICFRHKQGGGKMVSSRPVQVWVRGVLLHILLSTNHLIHSYNICVFLVFTEIYSVTLCMDVSVYWDEDIWGHKALRDSMRCLASIQVTRLWEPPHGSYGCMRTWYHLVMQKTSVPCWQETACQPNINKE